MGRFHAHPDGTWHTHEHEHEHEHGEHGEHGDGEYEQGDRGRSR